MDQTLKKNLQKIIIPLIALGIILLHLLSGSGFEYQRDELLYFSFSRHLGYD